MDWKSDYTSIDPKQLQNDWFRPILVKNRFLGSPYFHPKSKLLMNEFLSALTSLFSSATLLSSKPCHRDQPQSSGARPRQGRGGQDPDTEFRGAAKTRTRGGQEEDKVQPQSPAQRARGGQEPSKPSIAHELPLLSLSLSLCLSFCLSVFLPSFHSFILSFFHSFTHSFTHSFIHSFFLSFCLSLSLSLLSLSLSL